MRSESEFSSEIRLSRFISLEQWEFIRCSMKVDFEGIACEHFWQTRSSTSAHAQLVNKFT